MSSRRTETTVEITLHVTDDVIITRWLDPDVTAPRMSLVRVSGTLAGVESDAAA